MPLRKSKLQRGSLLLGLSVLFFGFQNFSKVDPSLVNLKGPDYPLSCISIGNVDYKSRHPVQTLEDKSINWLIQQSRGFKEDQLMGGISEAHSSVNFLSDIKADAQVTSGFFDISDRYILRPLRRIKESAGKDRIIHSSPILSQGHCLSMKTKFFNDPTYYAARKCEIVFSLKSSKKEKKEIIVNTNDSLGPLPFPWPVLIYFNIDTLQADGYAVRKLIWYSCTGLLPL